MQMLRDQILALLRTQEGSYCSGEEMSARFGVSRTAVWKAVSSLRLEGYAISSAPNRGYRLDSAPDCLDPAAISALLPKDSVMGSRLFCLQEVDSTNNECKRLAAGGMPEGAVVLADLQTGGRGRSGRSFLSPAGAGLYLSALLRPPVPPMEAVNLTAWVAVAICNAVEAVCAFRPSIKWPNDILANGKKLCGILTEMGVEGETGALDHVVIGIGINLRSTMLQMDPTLADKAVSLEDILGAAPRRDTLAAAVIAQLEQLRLSFPAQKEEYLNAYRQNCVTLGNEVSVLRPGNPPRTGRALSVDDQFRLLVDFGSGPRPVDAGEVSVRGLLGYV